MVLSGSDFSLHVGPIPAVVSLSDVCHSGACRLLSVKSSWAEWQRTGYVVLGSTSAT